MLTIFQCSRYSIILTSRPFERFILYLYSYSQRPGVIREASLFFIITIIHVLTIISSSSRASNSTEMVALPLGGVSGISILSSITIWNWSASHLEKANMFISLFVGIIKQFITVLKDPFLVFYKIPCKTIRVYWIRKRASMVSGEFLASVIELG